MLLSIQQETKKAERDHRRLKYEKDIRQIIRQAVKNKKSNVVIDGYSSCSFRDSYLSRLLQANTTATIITKGKTTAPVAPKIATISVGFDSSSLSLVVSVLMSKG